MKSLCLENLIVEETAGYWHFPREPKIRDPVHVWRRLRGVGERFKYDLCFDLISLFFLQVGFCLGSVGTFRGFVLLFIFLITQPDTGTHLPIFDHFLEGSSTPALPEGNNRASAAQHLPS